MGYFDLRPPINSSGSEVCQHLEGFDISLQTKIEKDEVVSKLLTCTTAKKKMTVSIACAWQASKERRRAGQRFRVDDCCGWPIGASHDRSAPRVGKRGAACFGGRSRSGYPSLLLRPLFPNRLVTGSFLIGWLLEYSVMLV